MPIDDRCPVCDTELIAFDALVEDRRRELEADPSRGRQSVEHRREKHVVCPDCTLEVHGCGQPYALPGTVRDRVLGSEPTG